MQSRFSRVAVYVAMLTLVATTVASMLVTITPFGNGCGVPFPC